MDQKKMMQQIATLQKKMEETQAHLKTQIIEGHCGGEKGVKVELFGDLNLAHVHLSPESTPGMSAEDRQVLEDMLLTAFRDAFQKTHDFREKEMNQRMGMELPQGLL